MESQAAYSSDASARAGVTDEGAERGRAVDGSLIALAAMLCFFAVAIGAFGAHGLEAYLEQRHSPSPEQLAKRLQQFDVGARYHLAHAVGLLALAAALPGRRNRPAACCLVAGTVLFSGSLYLLVVTDTPWLGAITPIGGVAWLVGWVWLAVAAASRRGRPATCGAA